MLCTLTGRSECRHTASTFKNTACHKTEHHNLNLLHAEKPRIYCILSLFHEGNKCLFSVSLLNVKCLMNKATFIMLCTPTYASYVLIVQWRVDTNSASQIFNHESIIRVSIHNAVSHNRCCSKEITINRPFLEKPAKNTFQVKALPEVR